MKPGWERELAVEAPVPAPSLERVRAALAVELGNPAQRSWKKDAATSFLGGLGIVGVVGAALALTQQLSVAPQNVPALGLLVATALVASLAGAAPARRWLQWTAVGLAVCTAAALVLLRSGGQPSTQPEWVCTLSHVAAGAPLLLLLWKGLRYSAPSLLRAVVGGGALGTTGALIGELGCAQGAAHVAFFHLSAWLVLAVVAGVVGTRLQRRSYAP